MNSNRLTLLLFVIGSILFIIGNEQLLNYTQYNPHSPMTRTEFQKEKTESLETRIWWIIQLAGLTFAIISLFEIVKIGEKLTL